MDWLDFCGKILKEYIILDVAKLSKVKKVPVQHRAGLPFLFVLGFSVLGFEFRVLCLLEDALLLKSYLQAGLSSFPSKYRN
jgi:hypothetical protein